MAKPSSTTTSEPPTGRAKKCAARDASRPAKPGSLPALLGLFFFRGAARSPPPRAPLLPNTFRGSPFRPYLFHHRAVSTGAGGRGDDTGAQVCVSLSGEKRLPPPHLLQAGGEGGCTETAGGGGGGGEGGGGLGIAASLPTTPPPPPNPTQLGLFSLNSAARRGRGRGGEAAGRGARGAAAVAAGALGETEAAGAESIACCSLLAPSYSHTGRFSWGGRRSPRPDEGRAKPITGVGGWDEEEEGGTGGALGPPAATRSPPGAPLPPSRARRSWAHPAQPLPPGKGWSRQFAPESEQRR